MFVSIGAALSGASPGPAREPVRRHSRLAGRCEGTFWRPTSRQEVRQVMFAARRYDLLGRGTGRRNGPLGHVALEVLDYLTNLVRYRTGRLEPSLDTLAARLRRSRGAIVKALAALREHGFLDWLRRYEPTGVTEGRGPRVRQVSNAYRLSLPERARQLLGRRGEEVPLPDDVAHSHEVREVEQRAHRDSLSPPELARFEVESGPLAQALAELGRRVQERESAKQPESHTQRFF
jgi:hypothetical protein